MASPPPAQAAEVPKGGAVKGAARGRRAQKKAAKGAEQQAQQQSQAQATSTKDTFKKARGACLEGRSYSVK